MQKRKILGYFIVVGGISILSFGSRITGNVVGLENASLGNYFFTFLGVVLFALGVAVVMGEKGNLEAIFENKEKFLEQHQVQYANHLRKEEKMPVGLSGRQELAYAKKELSKYFPGLKKPYSEQKLSSAQEEELRNYPQYTGRNKKILKLAERMNYEVKKGGPEGHMVFDRDGRKITDVASKLTPMTARSVLEALINGKPNFRKRNRESMNSP